MGFLRAVLVSLNLKYSCCAKLKERTVEAAVYGKTASSFTAVARLTMPSVGSGGMRPGSEASTIRLVE